MTAPTSREDLLRQAERARTASQFAESEALYRRVLAAHPDDPAALRGLVELAQRTGQHAAVAELLARARSRLPDEPDLLVLEGRVHFAQGQYARAVAACAHALAVQPDHAGASAGLAAARQAQALANDADYAVQADDGLGEGMLAEVQGANTLLVLFAGLGVGHSPPAFIFRRFLRRYPGVDKLFVRDLSLSWYLRGIPGVSRDVHSTAGFLRQWTLRYQRTVFIGCSAGATAAILYGQLLGVDKVLAFAPQTVLGERKPRELHDPRWEGRLARLRQEISEPHFLDLPALGSLTVPVDVHYSAGIPLDRLHAEALAGPRVACWPQPGSSHLVALTMRDQGLLAPVIDASLAG